MSLRNWLRKGWLVEHATSRSEILDLLKVVERDIQDSQVRGLSADWRLNIAYNAALQSATIALYASGYRAAHEAHHYRVIQSLRFTIQADREIIGQFDQFRKKRNKSDYERSGETSDVEVKEILGLAIWLRDAVMEWLNKNYPELN